MALRDTIRGDVKNVLMDPDEFAEAHYIEFNGIKGTFTCLLDEDTLSDGVIGQFESVFKRTHRLFIEQIHLPVKPVKGARMKIDGVFYIVQFCEPDNFGMTEILLERNQA